MARHSYEPESSSGRPRDESIDKAVLEAAIAALARDGLAGMSVTRIAAEAGTTRPAVYRRWPTITDLAVAAVARLADCSVTPLTGEPFTDLVAELENFRDCITTAGSMSLDGAMLSGAVPPEVRQAYLEQIVNPRRNRIRAQLTAAVEQGLLPKDADIRQAAASLTGSWYAYHLAGNQPPRDWPLRAARLAWRGCGGTLEQRRLAARRSR